MGMVVSGLHSAPIFMIMLPRPHDYLVSLIAGPRESTAVTPVPLVPVRMED